MAKLRRLGNLAEIMLKSHLLDQREQDYQERQYAQQDALRHQQLSDKLNLDAMDPAKWDAITRFAASRGIKIGAPRPTDQQLADPQFDALNKVNDPTLLPDEGTMARNLQSANPLRPELTAPRLGAVDDPASEYGPVGDTLPSTKFQPVRAKTIQDLLAARQDREGALNASANRTLALDETKAQGMALGKGRGEYSANNENWPEKLRQDIEELTKKGPVEAANKGLATTAEQNALNAPAVVAGAARRAGAISGAQTSADLNVRYNSPITDKIVAFETDKARRAAEISVGVAAAKEHQKDIKEAVLSAIGLDRQLQQLRPLYEKATKENDPTSAKLYHDLVEQAAVNAGRASGFKGQFREYEFNAARGLFPSLVGDRMAGSADAKWEALDNLVRHGPATLAAVPENAPIDEYLAASARLMGSKGPGDIPLKAEQLRKNKGYREP